MSQVDYTLTLTLADTNYQLDTLLAAEGHTGLMAFADMYFEAPSGNANNVRVGGSNVSGTEAGREIEPGESDYLPECGAPRNASEFSLRGVTTAGMTVNFSGRTFY